jgi:branched-chain amino acid transport system permease protein
MTNFGKVAFYGIGAFAASSIGIWSFLLAFKLAYPLHGLDTIIALGKLAAANPALNLTVFLLSLIVAFIVGGAFGYLITYPTLRVGPAFLGITVLSFGELMRIFLRHFEPTGGAYGLMGLPHPFAWVTDSVLKNALYVAFAFLILSFIYIFSQRLVNSPYGRVMKCIREDEIAALCMGKDVLKRKAQVLFIASGFSGVAGALLAFYIGFVSPDLFVPSTTFDVWAMVIIGGMANNRGAVLGTAVITILDRATAILNFLIPWFPLDPNYLRWMFTGILIITVLMFRPSGLLPEKRLKTPAWEAIGLQKEPAGLMSRLRSIAHHLYGIITGLQGRGKALASLLLKSIEKFAEWLMAGGR